MTSDVELRGEREPAVGHARPWTIATLAAAQFLVVLNGSIVNVALPDIGADLEPTNAGLNWIVTAYVLALGGLLLPGGRVADVFGARRVMSTATAAFTVAAVAAALAPSATILILARGSQGIAAAMLAPAALSLVDHIYRSGAERRRALGVWGAVGSSGGAVGALAGGLLTDVFGWRAVLLVNLPIGLVLLRAIPWAIPPAAAPPTSRRLGITAGTLLSFGLGAFLVALSTGRDRGWTSETTLGLLVTSAALIACFLMVQQRSDDPLLTFQLFRSRSLATGNVAALLAGAALFPTMLVLSLHMQRVLGYSPLQTGLAMMPLSGATIVAAALAPRLLATSGPRLTLGSGLGLLTSGAAWLATTPGGGTYFGSLLPPTLLFGMGLGFTFVPATYLAIHELETRHSGMGSALLNASQQLGGAVGLAVVMTLVDSRIGSSVTEGLASESSASGHRVGFIATAVVAAVALGTTQVMSRRTTRLGPRLPTPTGRTPDERTMMENR